MSEENLLEVMAQALKEESHQVSKKIVIFLNLSYEQYLLYYYLIKTPEHLVTTEAY